MIITTNVKKSFCAAIFYILMISYSLSKDISAKYLLGAQDVLTIRVYDLRRNAGEAYPWAALNGDFTVGADGSISLPIVGSIDAAGITSNDVAKRIGTALKDAVGLAETPVPAVQVIRYRPFYVFGAVKQPGKFDFAPGLTVLQAVSIAEGVARSSDVQGDQKDYIKLKGDIRSLSVEKLTFLARQARLEAEINSAGVISFPDNLKFNSREQRVAQALKSENNIFTIRKNSLQDEVAVIQKSISSLKEESASLDSKAKTIDRLVSLGGRELENVTDLVSKGLAISSRKLAAEQSQASYDNQRLDVQVSRLRVQQSISRSERDIIEIQAKYRNESQTMEIENRKNIQLTMEKLATARALLSEIAVPSYNDSEGGQKIIVRYKITRALASEAVTWIATENDLVQPGDVVRVEILSNFTPDEEQSADSSRNSLNKNENGTK